MPKLFGYKKNIQKSFPFLWAQQIKPTKGNTTIPSKYINEIQSYGKLYELPRQIVSYIHFEFCSPSLYIKWQAIRAELV